jgi:hypothetical protein
MEMGIIQVQDDSVNEFGWMIVREIDVFLLSVCH